MSATGETGTEFLRVLKDCIDGQLDALLARYEFLSDLVMASPEVATEDEQKAVWKRLYQIRNKIGVYDMDASEVEGEDQDEREAIADEAGIADGMPEVLLSGSGDGDQAATGLPVHSELSDRCDAQGTVRQLPGQEHAAPGNGGESDSGDSIQPSEFEDLESEREWD